MTHWKILRDPYLSALCRTRGEQAVWDAGFFLDHDPADAPLDDVDWLCTPRPKLSARGPRPAVLLSTGGFLPIHGGHLEMMERARVAALARGFDVLGGYLSPGHDDYLRLKCGPHTPSTGERLRQCAATLAGSDWLSLDPWEALHRRVAVNFTDVCARLEAYLRLHVHPQLTVIYVCGGDNARFALAFSERGHCIVVGRPGADAELKRWRDALPDHERVVWLSGDNPAASREMRHLTDQPARRARLVLRLEDARAVRSLGLGQLARFQSELLALLVQHADVRCVPLRVPDLSDAEHVINLDAMVSARHQLALSRQYAMGGYELLGYVARPGSPALAEQVARIPPGRYALCDDDSVTGGTLSFVRALLPERVELSETRLSVHNQPDEDVVDARDFLLGADDGGLVLLLPGGGIGRAPYLLPYVDPAVRASIPASHAFSLEAWLLNARTFAGTGLRVADLPPPARALFRGRDDEPLEQLCRWHAERLRTFSAP